MKNTHPESQRITLNICNMKRDLKLLNEGSPIYTRRVNERGDAISEWKQDGANISIRQNNSMKYSNNRVYRLSFELQLDSQYGL